MKWKKEEIKFLKENYPKKLKLEYLAKKLKRSIKSIKHKAAREEIRRPRFPSDKASEKVPRKITDKRYYEKNKDKIRKRSRNKRKMLKIEAIKKLGGKCQICGYNKCSSAFDFHHKGTKSDNLNTLLKNESRQKILKEIRKCILLCANCHRELHNMGP